MTTIQGMTPVATVEGEVGIEIEVEGTGVMECKPTGNWRQEHDGSLRGDSAEFVLKNPVKREQVRRHLLNFKRIIRTAKVQDPAKRAGIHVHINMQDREFREVAQFITLYMIFEPILIRWCGADRVGNLFCLSTSDASEPLGIIRDVIQEKSLRKLATDQIRYASLNLKALVVYGSLEFRSMRSTTNVDDIEQWVNILLALKDEAAQYNAPHEIIERFSVEDSEAFFRRVLGKFKGVEYNRGLMINGMRNAQFVAYARTEWDEDEEPEEDLPVDEPELPQPLRGPPPKKKHARSLLPSAEGANQFMFRKDGRNTPVSRDFCRHLALRPGHLLGPDELYIAKRYTELVRRGFVAPVERDAQLVGLGEPLGWGGEAAPEPDPRAAPEEVDMDHIQAAIARVDAAQRHRRELGELREELPELFDEDDEEEF